jgi:hypothetical protein
MKDSAKTYLYYQKKLLKEVKREGLTSQEEKLLKIVDESISNLSAKEIGKRASKIKAEFKRIRKTKKYKTERQFRNKFYKELKKFEGEEIRREAKRRIMKLPPAPDQMRQTFYKYLTYKELMETGITRMENGKVVRYKGLKAVKKQTESLMLSSDSEYKKSMYIETYIQNMRDSGVPEVVVVEGNTRYPIQEMEKYLKSLNPRLLTYALDMGYIKSIQVYYLWEDTDTYDLIKKIDYYTSQEGKSKIEANYNASESETNEMIKVIRKERRIQAIIDAKQINEIRKVHKNY